MKIITLFSLFITTFLFSQIAVKAEGRDGFKPMQIPISKDIDQIVLREKIREVVAGSVEAFIKRNKNPEFKTLAVMPCGRDVDNYASKELEDVLATLSKELGVQVISKNEVRNKLVEIIGQDDDLEGIVDAKTAVAVGNQLGCQAIVIPDLEVVTGKDGRVSIEMDFAPYSVKTGARLAGQGKDPILAYIEPQQSFMEEHGTKVYIGVAVFMILLIAKVILGVVKGASRPR